MCSHYSVCAGKLVPGPTADIIICDCSNTLYWRIQNCRHRGPTVLFHFYLYFNPSSLLEKKQIFTLLLSDCASLTSYSPPFSFPHAQVSNVLQTHPSLPAALRSSDFLQSRFSDHSTSSFLCFFSIPNP